MICYLDMDGVLTDFNRGVFEALGIPYAHDHPALMSYEWFSAVGTTRKLVDRLAGESFWAGLNWTPYGHDILNLLETEFGEENIFLLTIPMNNPGSWTGKREWVGKYMAGYVDRLIVTSAPKRLLAKRGRILIDDKESNCYAFIEAGADAIIVPAMWNKLRGWNVVERVKKALELYHG
jgi:5'(3')-deoxyribonucleotidase